MPPKLIQYNPKYNAKAPQWDPRITPGCLQQSFALTHGPPCPSRGVFWPEFRGEACRGHEGRRGCSGVAGNARNIFECIFWQAVVGTGVETCMVARTGTKM